MRGGPRTCVCAGQKEGRDRKRQVAGTWGCPGLCHLLVVMMTAATTIIIVVLANKLVFSHKLPCRWLSSDIRNVNPLREERGCDLLVP